MLKLMGRADSLEKTLMLGKIEDRRRGQQRTRRLDSITNSWNLFKLLSIESVMPSNHLIFCHPLLLSSFFASIKVFSNELALCIRWPKCRSFSFNINPSSEYSGLISFRVDRLISLLSTGLRSVFSSTTVQKHQFFGAQPSLWSSSHIHT